jgi:pyroglutamyl-peptidase
MSVLVQGFGPFGGFTANPSELLVQELAGREDPDLVTAVLPVSLRQVTDEIPRLMEKHRPRAWVGVGLAAGRTALSAEAVAVNLADWPESDADYDGLAVARVPVAPSGPAAHLTTLPVERILSSWREAGIPGYLSHTAGSYLCNLSFYAAAQAASDLGLECMVGFIHVPLLPELVSAPERQPSMHMNLQLAGLDLVVAACRDADEAAGERAEGAAEAPLGGIYLGRTA